MKCSLIRENAGDVVRWDCAKVLLDDVSFPCFDGSSAFSRDEEPQMNELRPREKEKKHQDFGIGDRGAWGFRQRRRPFSDEYEINTLTPLSTLPLLLARNDHGIKITKRGILDDAMDLTDSKQR
jgi:hypothetical protein